MIIDIKESSFFLYGDINPLLNNKRLSLTINRLNPIITEQYLEFPFCDLDKINVLKEIENLLKKFEITYSISENITTLFADYTREIENFSIFSENAKKIRDNEFDDNPELLEMFNVFQDVLAKKMKRRLYDLQLLSAFHMTFSQNSCNFAVPGAGKTSIVYASYAYLKNLPDDDPRHVDKLMIVGPLSSFKAWENEYFECHGENIKSTRLSGNTEISKNEKKQHLYSPDPTELTLINHGYVNVLEKEIRDFLHKNKTMLVVDEAHRIKNARGIWGVSATEISKYAISRIILTGTPVPNGYEDLYNLYKFIYPYKFQDILKIHLQQLEDMTKNADDESPRVKEFIQNISPYFIRIKKKDLHLPDVIEHIISVDMDDTQREIYDYIETKYINSFKSNPSGTLKDLLNKAKLIRLRQAAINPHLLSYTIKESLETNEYEEDYLDMPEEFQTDSTIKNKILKYSENHIPPKFIRTLDIANSILEKNEKVIIWTIFIQNAKGLQKYLENKGIKAKLLIGEIDLLTREDTIVKFNNPDNDEFSVVIANPFSVAESISLHKGCHNAIYIERDYNCSNFIQSKDRIHRVGLDPDQLTNYYYLVTKDTVDEIINEKLKEKIKRMAQIIDGDIPLFFRMNDSDDTDIIKELIKKYAGRA